MLDQSICPNLLPRTTFRLPVDPREAVEDEWLGRQAIEVSRLVGAFLGVGGVHYAETEGENW